MKVKNHITRLHTDGNIDDTFNPSTGANGELTSSVCQPDGKILIAGNFTSYYDELRFRIARLNTDGSLDYSFDTNYGAGNQIYSLSLQNDGKVIVAGDFTYYNGTPHNRIVRLINDGTVDTLFNPEIYPNNIVYTTAIQNDGKIIVGGMFVDYFGTTIKRILRYNPDGSFDSTFLTGEGANEQVKTSVIQSDGKILLGGDFTSFDGSPYQRIIRLDSNGSIDASFNPGAGANGSVNSIYLMDDGKIVIAGDFTYYDGTVINRIARINSDGSIDPSFDPGTGANYSIKFVAVQNSGQIIIGGDFTSFDGEGRKHIAIINHDGSLDISTVAEFGANGIVSTICIQNENKIIVGGAFTSCIGIGRNRIARLNVCSEFSFLQKAILCEGDSILFNGNIYKSPGLFIDTLISVYGCDSILKLDVKNAVDTSVSIVGTILTVNMIADGYQWVDCNNNITEIPGETNQSFTPTVNGDYAVIITQNGCTDTSACYTISGIGINESYNDFGVRIYPNPVRDNLIIEGLTEGDIVQIFDILGNRIHCVRTSDNPSGISLNSVPGGVYFIEINRDSELRVFKIIKQ